MYLYAKLAKEVVREEIKIQHIQRWGADQPRHVWFTFGFVNFYCEISLVQHPYISI